MTNDKAQDYDIYPRCGTVSTVPLRGTATAASAVDPVSGGVPRQLCVGLRAQWVLDSHTLCGCPRQLFSAAAVPGDAEAGSAWKVRERKTRTVTDMEAGNKAREEI